MKVIVSFLGAVLLFWTSGDALAEAQTSERWSIDKIVARATEKTPEMNALLKDIESADNLARQAGKWDNPDLALAGGPMTQSTSSGRMVDLSIKQNFPLFGQRSIAEKVGEQNRVAIELSSKKQIAILKYEVIRLSVHLAALEEQSRHILHRREKIGLIAKFLNTRPFASPSQAAEKTLILNRLREIEEKFLEISAARENAWKALNVFLSLEKPIVPDVKWERSPPLLDRDTLISEMEEQNPDLKSQKILISKASLEAEQAAKKRFPEIRLGVGYNEQALDTTQRTYSGLVEFSLPLVDRGDYAKQAALAEKEAATYRLEQKRRELFSRFDQGWTSLRQSQKRIELYPLSLVPSLESQMDRTEQAWKKGLVPVTSYLELENQVHEQASKVFDAQADYVDAVIQLKIIAGVDPGNGEK